MSRKLLVFVSLIAFLCIPALTAGNVSTLNPSIGTLALEGAKTVCVAWSKSDAPSGVQPKTYVWVGLPAAIKPFGMRAYVSVDGMRHPLRQIAYAKTNGGLSIHYRTLGDRSYDVRINLSGLGPAGIESANLAGELTVSRFGLFTELRVSGSCLLP
jgi:hypothetical protein